MVGQVLAETLQVVDSPVSLASLMPLASLVSLGSLVPLDSLVPLAPLVPLGNLLCHLAVSPVPLDRLCR